MIPLIKIRHRLLIASFLPIFP